MSHTVAGLSSFRRPEERDGNARRQGPQLDRKLVENTRKQIHALIQSRMEAHRRMCSAPRPITPS